LQYLGFAFYLISCTHNLIFLNTFDLNRNVLLMLLS